MRGAALEAKERAGSSPQAPTWSRLAIDKEGVGAPPYRGRGGGPRSPAGSLSSSGARPAQL
jgi:hypothetical protein